MSDTITDAMQDSHPAIERLPSLGCGSARNGGEGVIENWDPERLLISDGHQVTPKPESQLCDHRVGLRRVRRSMMCSSAGVIDRGLRRPVPPVMANPTRRIKPR